VIGTCQSGGRDGQLQIEQFRLEAVDVGPPAGDGRPLASDQWAQVGIHRASLEA
jgi:hypothetical protein